MTCRVRLTYWTNRAATHVPYIRRKVRVSEITELRCRGGRTRIWAFSVADIAEVLGESEECIRTRIYRGKLDPTTLRGLMDAMRGQV